MTPPLPHKANATPQQRAIADVRAEQFRDYPEVPDEVIAGLFVTAQRRLHYASVDLFDALGGRWLKRLLRGRR